VYQNEVSSSGGYELRIIRNYFELYAAEIIAAGKCETQADSMDWFADLSKKKVELWNKKTLACYLNFFSKL
jgi:hypothetical protein